MKTKKHIKGKLKKAVREAVRAEESEILVPKKWLETLLSLSEEAEKESINNTKIRIKTTCLIGFASSAKSILNLSSK